MPDTAVTRPIEVRTWRMSLPDEPDGVNAVYDEAGHLWERQTDDDRPGWWKTRLADCPFYATWAELVRDFGPIAEATPDA